MISLLITPTTILANRPPDRRSHKCGIIEDLRQYPAEPSQAEVDGITEGWRRRAKILRTSGWSFTITK